MIKYCEYEGCGKKYNANHSSQKYCSRTCYLASVREEHKADKIQYMNLPEGTENKDIEDIFDALELYQQATHKLSKRKDRVDIKIETDNPIYIAFLADIHLGAVSTNIKAFRDTIDSLAEIPNMYMVSVGDTIDNFLPTKHGEGQFEVLCPPEIQKRLIEYMFSKLEGRILGLIQGDHEEFSHATDDFDFTKYLSERFNCTDLGFGGFINLTVGKVKYVIHARHRYRFNSTMNLTHSIKRMREHLGDFDVGVVAHNHQASIEWVDMVDKTRVFIRPGTFKGADRFARKIGFMDTGHSLMPIIELHPDKRVMNIYPDIEYLRRSKNE